MSGGPFQRGDVVGLTRTDRPPAIELDETSWSVGTPGGDSFVSPWYVFTIKHADVSRPKGALTAEATNRVTAVVGSMLGVE